MIFLSFLFGIVLWQEGFVDNNLPVAQLYEYTVNIQLDNGYLHLKGNPEAEGFSCAWFYLNNSVQLKTEDIIEISMKVSGVNTRLKYFYKKQGSSVYWGQEIIVQQKPEWQKIRILLNQAKPFFSSNFPFALTPNKTPALYFFIDNLTSGNFDTAIDYITIVRPDIPEEE